MDKELIIKIVVFVIFVLLIAAFIAYFSKFRNSVQKNIMIKKKCDQDLKDTASRLTNQCNKDLQNKTDELEEECNNKINNTKKDDRRKCDRTINDTKNKCKSELDKFKIESEQKNNKRIDDIFKSINIVHFGDNKYFLKEPDIDYSGHDFNCSTENDVNECYKKMKSLNKLSTFIVRQSDKSCCIKKIPGDRKQVKGMTAYTPVVIKNNEFYALNKNTDYPGNDIIKVDGGLDKCIDKFGKTQNVHSFNFHETRGCQIKNKKSVPIISDKDYYTPISTHQNL
jgi:hypothetical protein